MRQNTKKVVQKELLQKLVSVVWLVIDELGTSLIEPFLVEPLSLPNTLLSLHALLSKAGKNDLVSAATRVPWPSVSITSGFKSCL